MHNTFREFHPTSIPKRENSFIFTLTTPSFISSIHPPVTHFSLNPSFSAGELMKLHQWMFASVCIILFIILPSQVFSQWTSLGNVTAIDHVPNGLSLSTQPNGRLEVL